jgi:hypothetical protein
LAGGRRVRVGFGAAVWYRRGRGDLGRRSYASRLSGRRNITIVRGTVRVSWFWNRADGMGEVEVEL